jgi:hypothetical protein
MSLKYIVGSYVTSPTLFEWDEQKATEYYRGIKTIPDIQGLEHPFWGKLHAFDDEWFLRMIDPQWDHALTCVPGTMLNLQQDPTFGLASDSASGREAAVEFIDRARQAALKINTHVERAAVKIVQLHSAPSRLHQHAKSSQSALVRSLTEIHTWDWQGAKLVIEHCDAMTENHPAEKGFLSLEEEIAALQKVNEEQAVDIGITINWGRSVLEHRDVEGALSHLKVAKEAGLLRGLVFSGCSDQETAWGTWKDTHMPPAPAAGMQFFAEHSLMTEENIRCSLVAADLKSLDYLGIKIMDLPNTSSIARRVGLNRDFLALLNRIIGTLD